MKNKKVEVFITYLDDKKVIFKNTRDYPKKGEAFYISTQQSGEGWTVGAVAWMPWKGKKVPYIYGISKLPGAEIGAAVLMQWAVSYAKAMGAKELYAQTECVSEELLNAHGFGSVDEVYSSVNL